MTAQRGEPAQGHEERVECWCEPTPNQPHPWKPWEINLCDPDGIVRLTNLAWRSAVDALDDPRFRVGIGGDYYEIGRASCRERV